MTSKPRLTTDPAREFARLMQYLLSLDGNKSHASYRFISAALKGKVDHSALPMAYAICAKRGETLLDLIKSTEDDQIDDETKSIALNAVHDMRRIFIAEHFARDWGSVIAECVPKEHLISLAFLSPIVSRRHPLPAIRPEEIDILITRLEQASMELSLDAGLPSWAYMPLKTGIDELIFVLRNFVLFGHDETTGRILLLLSTATHVVDNAGTASGHRFKLAALCGALLVAVELFAAPSNVSQAYATYRGWMVDAAEAVRPLLTPPPLRIEGPKQGDAEAPEDA